MPGRSREARIFVVTSAPVNDARSDARPADARPSRSCRGGWQRSTRTRALPAARLGRDVTEVFNGLTAEHSPPFQRQTTFHVKH
jgi:hypothetical protein